MTKVELYKQKIAKRSGLFKKILVVALFALLSIPLVWFMSVKVGHADFTLKQIIINMCLAYSTIGLQLYGIRIFIKLIKNYSKQEWLSADNLKLYQRLGATIFIFVFVQYIAQSISVVVNADKLQSHEPVTFFHVDTITLLILGAFMYLGSRHRLSRLSLLRGHEA